MQKTGGRCPRKIQQTADLLICLSAYLSIAASETVVQLQPYLAAQRAETADWIVGPAIAGVALDSVEHIVDDERHTGLRRQLVDRAEVGDAGRRQVRGLGRVRHLA